MITCNFLGIKFLHVNFKWSFHKWYSSRHWEEESNAISDKPTTTKTNYHGDMVTATIGKSKFFQFPPILKERPKSGPNSEFTNLRGSHSLHSGKTCLVLVPPLLHPQAELPSSLSDFPVELISFLSYFQLILLMPSFVALCNSNHGSNSHSFTSLKLLQCSWLLIIDDCERFLPNLITICLSPLFPSDFGFMETSNGSFLIKYTYTVGWPSFAALSESDL